MERQQKMRKDLEIMMNMGRELAFYNEENELCVGEVWKCEQCENYGYVNAMKVVLADDDFKNGCRLVANLIKHNNFELTELNADDDGATVCHACFLKNEKARAL